MPDEYETNENDEQEGETPLRDFLVRVGNDPRLLITLWGRPDELLEEPGLRPEHKDLLRRGNLEEIRNELAREAGRGGEDFWIIDSGWVIIRI